MGTRHLIAVVIDGDFKVAQYGQWDGYPDGQGRTVLEFLQRFEIQDFKAAFLAKVRALTWLSKEEAKKVDATPDWTKVYPHLSRDAGGKVLAMIADSDVPLMLQDSRGFAGDSLMCEWGYVVDLDAGVLEVYQGFNTVPTPADSRFPSGADWYERDRNKEYEPIALIKSYPLDALPTVEAFVAEINALTTEPEEAEAEATA